MICLEDLHISIFFYEIAEPVRAKLGKDAQSFLGRGCSDLFTVDPPRGGNEGNLDKFSSQEPAK